MKFSPSVFKNRIIDGLWPFLARTVDPAPPPSLPGLGAETEVNAPPASAPVVLKDSADDSGQPLKYRIQNNINALAARVDRALNIVAPAGAATEPQKKAAPNGTLSDALPSREPVAAPAATPDDIAAKDRELAAQACELRDICDSKLEEHRREIRGLAEAWQQQFQRIVEGARRQEAALRALASSEAVSSTVNRTLLAELRELAGNSNRWSQGIHLDLTHQRLKVQELTRSILQKLESIDLNVEKKLDAYGLENLVRQEDIQRAVAAVMGAAASLTQRLDAHASESSARGDGIRMQIDGYGADGRTREEEIERTLQGVQAALTSLSESLQAHAAASNARDDGIRMQIDAYGADSRTREEGIQRELQRQKCMLDGHLMEALHRVKPPVFQAGGNLLIMQVDGFVVATPEEEWRMAAYLAYWGTLEQGLARHIQQTIRPGMVVVDVGANIGLHTLRAARLVAGSGKVYSFEPTPRTFEILRGNVQANGFLDDGRVDLRCLAVSDSNGTTEFYEYPGECGLNTFFKRSGKCRTLTVKTVTLDDAFPPGTRVDFVKVDVEGAELLVLHGMRRIIEENSHISVVIEFAPEHLMRAGIHPGDFLSEIGSMGFDISCIDDLSGEVSPADPEELQHIKSVNLLLHKPTSVSDSVMRTRR